MSRCCFERSVDNNRPVPSDLGSQKRNETSEVTTRWQRRLFTGPVNDARRLRHLLTGEKRKNSLRAYVLVNLWEFSVEHTQISLAL